MSNGVVPQNEGKDVPSPKPQPLKSRSPSGIFRKLTTRLKSPTLNPKSANFNTPPSPKSPTHPSTRLPTVPEAPTDIAAVKRRRAALQQLGLVPLRKDLSQLEAELDQRFSHVVESPQDQQDQDDLSSAEKIRREWQAKNEIQVEKQGNDAGSTNPDDAPSPSSDPKSLGKLGLLEDIDELTALELIIPTSSDVFVSLTSPVSLSPIPETCVLPEISEEDVITPENEKELPSASSATVDPLNIPLPDSPLSSSVALPDLAPSTRESKRPPPILLNITTIDANDTTGEVTRGRSSTRDSVQSITSKQSLPALSPTMTASSSSSVTTPRDDESRERMEALINRSGSVKSRSSRLGKASDICRDSEDLDVVHESIHESPELAATETRSWNPNRESISTLGSTGFDSFVGKREKRRRMSTGIFQSVRRNSGSTRGSRKSAGSELSLMWGAIANDFSLKPFEGTKSRSATLPSKSTPADENKETTETQSRPTPEPAQPKMTRSRSVIASLGLKMARKAPQQKAKLPRTPSPVRRPTIRIMDNRENLIQEVKGIEDEESRRLTEMAFMDF